MFLNNDNNQKAKNKALNLLGFRAHSKNELLNKLKKTFESEQAKQAVQKMEELGLVDDLKYAQNYALEIFRRKKFAKRRIAQELFLKGISEENINLALENEEINEYDAVLNLVEKRFSEKLENEKERNKVIATLQRYGYTWDLIKKVMGEFDN